MNLRLASPMSRSTPIRAARILGWGILGLLWLSGCGVGEAAKEGAAALLVTQLPHVVPAHATEASALDSLYPTGSRIVLIRKPTSPELAPLVLTAGFCAAGDPVLSSDGHRVLCVARRSPADAWQVHLLDLKGAPPRAITDMTGGAFNPTWISEDRIAFSSPVPDLDSTHASLPSAIFAQSTSGGPATRLTFGIESATDVTLLRDGRLLFVSGVPETWSRDARQARSLFVVRPDGTELEAFAAQHDRPANLRRPREGPDGRVVFVATGAGSSGIDGRAEQVSRSRPFSSRSIVFPQFTGICRSIEPLPDGGFLASLRDVASLPETRSFGIYRMGAAWSPSTRPLYDDPAWHEVEAVLVRKSSLPPLATAKPLGRQQAGILVCLDSNYTDQPDPAVTAYGDEMRPQSVLVWSHRAQGPPEVLGEAALQEDGSFQVRVPSDAPLSFELRNAAGVVTRRCPPALWVRPGERRVCAGCHEPHAATGLPTAPNRRRTSLAEELPPVDLVTRHFGGSRITRSNASAPDERSPQSPRRFAMSVKDPVSSCIWNSNSIPGLNPP